MTTPEAAQTSPGAPGMAGTGKITVVMLRQTFAEWQVFEHDGTWWAARGGVQAWSGPRSLIQRVLSSADLTVLAEKLCAQEWLDTMTEAELAAFYQASLVRDVT
jgi:hypothetical protein